MGIQMQQFKFTVILLILISVSNLNALNENYWKQYKQNFITADGRVIDRFNKNISHSESVGYGMFFAISYNDNKTFNNIRSWLHKNMRLGKSNLYGWKWGKKSDNSWGMLDRNNATDGDMWIAYSLLLAYEKWKDKKYLIEAKKLILAIRKYSVVKLNGTTILLPSQYGFVKKSYIKLNPSYTIPFIFDKFAIYDKHKIWKILVTDSIDMFKGSAVGNLKIHPDWIKLDRKTMTYSYYKDESIFGFDSVRTPLFLAYQYRLTKDKDIKNLLKGYIVFLKYIKKLNKFIYQVDFKNHKIRFKNPPYGFLIVYDYLYQLFGINPPKELKFKIKEGLKNEADNYYSFSLLLFTDILK